MLNRRKPLKQDNAIWDNAPDTLQVSVRKPRPIPDPDDSLEFHAARLMLLMLYAGNNDHLIEGRTKLAKLDFFVRYPAYLARAAEIKGVKANVRTRLGPESKMMRYKYGPWDAKYYDIFAFIAAKEFVEIRPSKARGDSFRLTAKGVMAVHQLEGPEYDEIIERCQLVKKLFGTVAGSTIKDFIYQHFTNIVGQTFGTEIEGPDVK